MQHNLARRAGSAAAFLFVVFALFFSATPAQALPSFARQTGMVCTACHIGAFGPQLNDYGRQFKLNGYVWGDAEVTVPALSAMLLASYNHTAKGQPGGAAAGFGDNNSIALDQASLFYAGRILAKVGALVQGTYDGIAKRFTIDNVDIRFANQGIVGGKPIVYGVSLNNNPSVQDLWHTTPAWGFPFVQSGLAPAPPGGALIDGGLAQQVGGATAYAMWNDLIYIDAGLYGTLPSGTQSALGVDPTGENQIKGTAPYWRVKAQQSWGSQYLAFGAFGMRASVYPGRDKSAGVDHYSDIGVDANYEVQIGTRNFVVAGASYIRERQTLFASNQLGLADNTRSTFSTLRTRITYTLDNTYGMSGGFFKVSGTQDGGVYAADPISGSNVGTPNSNGYLLEATYTPFGKDTSLLSPWLNLRLGLQYTAYTKFNGSKSNYDGFGRNAGDNNTVFAYAWLAF